MSILNRYLTSNPRIQSLKKWFYEALKEKYSPHDTIIERVGSCLVTEKDIQEFGQLISDVYKVGYMRALEDYKEEFSKHGLTVNIVNHQNLDISETIE